MSDKLQALLQFLEARIRIIAFLVGGVMLGAVYYISVSDAGFAPRPPEPPAVVTPAPTPVVGAAMQKEFDLGAVPIESSEFTDMISNSMFDPKRIIEKGDLDRKAMRKYQEALQAFNNQDYRNAFDLCNDALGFNPTHKQTLDLLKRVEKVINNL